MKIIGKFSFCLQNVVPIALKVAINPYILSGLTCYVISVIVWLLVLSRVDVSYAYPLLSVGYIVVALASKVFFDEPVGPIRWAGIIVICIGVYLITRSAS